MFET